MSHLSKIQTALKSMPFVLLAMEALGHTPLEGVNTVAHYYGISGRQGHETQTPVDYAFGPKSSYHLGFKEVDGRVEILGDFWGIPNAFLETLGPGFSKWEWKDGGHVATGKPTLLLQEYHLQIGEAAGAAKGFTVGSRTKDEQGNVQIRFTGGNFRAGQAAILIAYADGTLGTAAEGFDDKSVAAGVKSCEAATSWLEDIMGKVADRQYVDDFFHTRDYKHLANPHRQTN